MSLKVKLQLYIAWLIAVKKLKSYNRYRYTSTNGKIKDFELRRFSVNAAIYYRNL